MTGHADLVTAAAGSAVIAVAVTVLFATLCRAALSVGRRLRYRSVFASAILQSPGFRLRRRFDLQRDQARVLAAALLALPLVFLAVLLAWPGEIAASPGGWRGRLMLVVAAAALAWLCVALAQRLIEKARLRFALAADVAVSQALSRVMQRDFAVFHDVPAAAAVLDKVVVGHKGVFALTVVAHRGRRGDRTRQAAARFDGQRLVFPDGTTHEAAHAKHNARALARELGTQTGAPVAVCPVLVVPGWPLTCIAQPDFPVVNERNIDLIAEWTRPQDWLLDEDVEALRTQLSERCRDRRYAD